MRLREKYKKAYKKADLKWNKSKKGYLSKRKYWLAHPSSKRYSYPLNRLKPKYRFNKGILDAKARELDWSLTFSEYLVLINKPCHYCSSNLLIINGTSLDRINNEKGYTLDNVLPCCKSCNLIRGAQLSVLETEVVIKALLEYRLSFRQGQKTLN